MRSGGKSGDEIASILLHTEHLLPKLSGPRAVERVLKQKFDISSRTAQRYIRAVKRMWAIIGHENYKEHRVAYRARLMDIYEEARRTGNLDAAIKICMLVADVDGIREPAQQRFLVNQDQPPIIIDNDHALRILDEMRAQKGLNANHVEDVITITADED